MEIVEDLENKDWEENDTFCSFKLRKNHLMIKKFQIRHMRVNQILLQDHSISISDYGIYIAPSKYYVENESCNLLDMSNSQEDSRSEEEIFKSKDEETTRVDWEGELTSALDELRKQRKENWFLKIKLQKYKEILDRQKDQSLNVKRTIGGLKIQKVDVKRNEEVLTNKEHEELE